MKLLHSEMITTEVAENISNTNELKLSEDAAAVGGFVGVSSVGISFAELS